MNKYVFLFICLLLSSTLLSSVVKIKDQTDSYDLSSQVYHPNGKIAWDGKVLYHSNGKQAWGGGTFGKNVKYDNDIVFYYANGNKAWGGGANGKNYKYDNDIVFYYPNGNKAWGGGANGKNYKYDNDIVFYYANGKEAWRGGANGKVYKYSNDDIVYHDNGKQAWKVAKNAPLQDENGKIIGTASTVKLQLGEGAFLYLSYTGDFQLVLELGEGFALSIAKDAVYVDVYDNRKQVH